MSAAELGTFIQSLLTLGFLGFLIFAVWPEQRIDLFRQQMFEVRDELFDYAANGNIAFNDPAYLRLRELMNGFIRYAHNLTPFRILMSYVKWKFTPSRSGGEWTASWSKALSQVEDSNVRSQLEMFHLRATALVVGQFVLSPGVLIVGGPILAVAIIFHAQWTTLRAIYRDLTQNFPISVLEDEAAKA